MQLIDGKATAEAIKAEIAEEVKSIMAAGGKQPHLAAVLVGHDGGSETYVKNKVIACEKCGFKSTLIRYEDDVTEDELLACVERLNNDNDVDGFIVQLPLPRHIDEQKIIEAIDYRKDVVKNIEVYGEMHRYIPYLAKNAGFDKIGEKPVHHQARKFGKSKFMGWNRFFNGYLDLITLWFLSSFGRKPMHVFGFLGTLMFFIGFLSVVALGVDKLWCLAHGIPQRLITDSPYFFIALTVMMIGTQFFLAGFIGDLVSRSSQNRNDYQIEKTLRCEK